MGATPCARRDGWCRARRQVAHVPGARSACGGGRHHWQAHRRRCWEQRRWWWGCGAAGNGLSGKNVRSEHCQQLRLSLSAIPF